MRRKLYQSAIIALFLVLILLPLFQQITGVLPEPRLTEKRLQLPVPSLAMESLLSGDFQNKFDKYMNDSFGFRSWMVMLNNQVDITLFRVTR